MAGVLPATHSMPLLCATFKSAPGGFLTRSGGAHRQTTGKNKGPVFRLSALFYLMSGGSYTRMGAPLPSALRRFTSEFGMGQVGPPRYCRQTNSFSNAEL